MLARLEDQFASETRARKLTRERKSKLLCRSPQVARGFLLVLSVTARGTIAIRQDRGGVSTTMMRVNPGNELIGLRQIVNLAA